MNQADKEICNNPIFYFEFITSENLLFLLTGRGYNFLYLARRSTSNSKLSFLSTLSLYDIARSCLKSHFFISRFTQVTFKVFNVEAMKILLDDKHSNRIS